ncbi:hypothetical protein PRZ48_003098 [Zasmidium cellare]|uniref:F-box domain-containing protein n=1 Tax=Zasmidium cellare TaxID=395010 RepID=A0ABR0EV33_ZASCE|nr:hypothetical protein PRZ48_003098 [Zasmidium cellare]
MAPSKVEVIHAQRRGTAKVEHSNLEPLWQLRNTTTGKPIRAIRLRDVTAIEVSILHSERVILALVTAKRRHVFISTKPADANWDAVLVELRAATRGQFEKFRAPSLRRFPPIEYLFRGGEGAETQTKAKKEPTHLFSLPQELLDVIFDLAYPAVDRMSVVTPYVREGDYKRQVREGKRNSPMQPWTPKVNDFLVSKLFFKEASKAWVRNQHFSDMDFGVGVSISTEATVMRDFFRTGILGQHMTKASLSFHHTWRWIQWSGPLELPSLLDLTLKVGVEAFEPIEPRLAWKMSLEEKDFETIAQRWGLKHLRGLKRLVLIPDRAMYAETREERQSWKGNVSALESFLLPIVTKPRPRDQPGKDATSNVQAHLPYACLPSVNTASEACFGGRQDVATPRGEGDVDRFPPKTFRAFKLPAGVRMTGEGLLLEPWVLNPLLLSRRVDFIKQNVEHIMGIFKEAGTVKRPGGRMKKLEEMVTNPGDRVKKHHGSMEKPEANLNEEAESMKKMVSRMAALKLG